MAPDPLVINYPCVLTCVPYELIIDSVFWHGLAQRKLQLFRLNEGPFMMEGNFEIGYFRGSPCRVSLDFRAFQPSVQSTSIRSFPVQGQVYIYNTVERFKERLLAQSHLGSEIDQRAQWFKDILLHQTNELRKSPNLLLQMLLLVHADLKKHLFRFRAAFPVIGLEPPPRLMTAPCKLSNILNQTQLENFLQAWDSFSSTCSSFLFIAEWIDFDQGDVRLHSVDKNIDLSKENTYLCVCDPCTAKLVPGWTLRSALALVAAAFVPRNSSSQIIKAICFRDRMKGGVRKIGHSPVLHIEVPILDGNTIEKCKVWGWEHTKKPWHLLDLSATMDPIRLAETAVDLNLELMRWRLLPQLNLEKVSSVKCLLFGGGTLGCNVARQLLAWGVRHISIVDNGLVSYSNPVRQTLFQHDDCKDGGKPKAIAAADALKRIFPGIIATGYNIAVPMPGHSVSRISSENKDANPDDINVADAHMMQVEQDCTALEQLVEQHDVLFLLLDSREGRWLPTLLGRKHRKVVINAALGFDSYLVMRHGILPTKEEAEAAENTLLNSIPVPTLQELKANLLQRIPGDELGCYFCSDVIGPANSMRDRTLDQQCTVTRPGLSMIAAGLAVELMVSVLQHPSGARAKADTDDYSVSDESPLGLIPHQIRGFLSKYCTLLPSMRAFVQCTACSDTVLEEFQRDGFRFLLKAFDDPNYLEEITGLKKLHEEAGSLADIETWSDEEAGLES